VPKAPKIDESRVLEACEAAQCEKKPNLAKIAREHDVSYEILRGRIRRGQQARSARIPKDKALDEYQEKALVQWIIRMSTAIRYALLTSVHACSAAMPRESFINS
jgi:transposase-like protein